MTLISKA